MALNNFHYIRRRTRWRVLAALTGVCFLAFANGCSTSQPETNSYFKTAQTELIVHSDPPAKAYVNNREIGFTPLNFRLEYEQQVDNVTTKVTYWDTQPGIALLLSIMSLGLYLPFSFIPVDSQTSVVPQHSFRSNHFQLTIEATGYEQWSQEVVTQGEPAISIDAQLKRSAQR